MKVKKRHCLLIFLLAFITFIFFWTQPDFQEIGTIKIWDKEGILLYESAGNVGKKIPIIYDRLPKYLIEAVIVSEDSTFWTNPGVDFKAIIRSLFTNLKEKRIVSGASTITQQLARVSIISPQKIPKQSITRKIREILLALRLSALYSKKEILTMYLNEMYFGNLAYGVQAASTTYFGKDTSQLSLAESAFLTGLLSSPDRRNPFTNIKEAKERQKYVFDLMVKHGSISEETAEEAFQEKLALANGSIDIKAPHFVHYILQEMETLQIKVKQGINIYTTLDYPTFLLSEEIARLWVGKLGRQHDLSNAALVLIKNDTGEILDMLGGIDYFNATISGQINMANVLRQPGSVLKPITYAVAFMQGDTPATLIYDVKKTYKTKKGEGFTPNNYDGRYHGLVLAREALASSFNLPAVDILNRVKISLFLKTAKSLGINTLTQEDRYDLALTLGGGEVTLLDLVNTYGSFARGGEFITPFAIRKIVTDKGEILYEHKNQEGKQVLGEKGEEIAYLISDILSDPKARIPGFGEKNPLVLSHKAAVKTGTTTDWHDNWTIGYTPSYTVGVWVGNNDNHPMREITGIVGAAPIWNQFFEEFLKGKTKENFKRPGGIKEIEICKVSGQLPDELCLEKMVEVFVEGTEPKEQSKIYKKVKIDKRNKLLAKDSCLSQFIEEKIFIDYPPEVYSWAVENKQEVIPNRFSPWCDESWEYSAQSLLEITYPREKTVFEYAPELISNQAIVFEANVSQDISQISWFVDGTLIGMPVDFPFKVSWALRIGKHTIKAIGKTAENKEITSKEVNISVVDYKQESS